MTSECYVYITMPGSTEMVTAGRFRVEHDVASGVSRGRFVYGKSYLARRDRVDFDPRELKLADTNFTTVKLGGIFGALRDAAPDAWGRRLIDRHAGSAALNELDYLLKSPDDRAGALGFGLSQNPPAPVWSFNRTVDLESLINIANKIVSDDADPDAKPINREDVEQVERLLQAGTSMGGARPKATVEHDGHLWLAKFPLNGDKWNNPRVEHAVMTLARECGIDTAETDVIAIGDRDVLAVRRFDRDPADAGYYRKRMISALTMLGADEIRDDRWSYVALAEEMRRSVAGNIDKQLHELFRRICFNCLVSNIDDHPRNHAFIADANGWRLSPAYDITPTPMYSVSRRDLAMEIGTHGRYANRANLISAAKRFRISAVDAASIVDTMTEQVRKTWYGTARASGVSELDCEMIAPAFVYEGFGYEP
ncbi:HipA domain-containing protein [Agrobacterium rubi]|nr:HipA domain-containing protein [Agrobacterium rubi]NTF25056.1 HipA domain-containing protein [Agrobacterium rubi]